MHRLSWELASKTLVLESGKLARQAKGSVLITYGDVQVLATVYSEPKEGIDCVPLTVKFKV